MGFIHGKMPILAAGLVLAASMASATTPPKKTSAKARTHSASKVQKTTRHSGKKSRKPRGQQAIDTERTLQIQEALAREHYLKTEPTGKWDATTQEAMRRFQADQGWQTKVVPDSRGLIRLGLGPNHDHLLNPESAMVTGTRVQSAQARPASGSTSLPANSSTGSTPVGTSSDLSSSR